MSYIISAPGCRPQGTFQKKKNTNPTRFKKFQNCIKYMSTKSACYDIKTMCGTIRYNTVQYCTIR